MAFYTRQITFKVSQAIATQLDKLGAGRDLSRNLMAKELVIDALNRVGPDPLPLNAAASNGSRHEQSEFVELRQTDQLVGSAALQRTPQSAIPSDGVAIIRRDIRCLTTAFFCQAGLGIEAARERTKIIFGSGDE